MKERSRGINQFFRHFRGRDWDRFEVKYLVGTEASHYASTYIVYEIGLRSCSLLRTSLAPRIEGANQVDLVVLEVVVATVDIYNVVRIVYPESGDRKEKKIKQRGKELKGKNDEVRRAKISTRTACSER